MTDPIWQAEKKKIMTRLSIAIYRMTNEQLVALFHLFKGLEFKEKDKLLQLPKADTDRIERPRDRQLLIAHFFLLINQLSEAELLAFMNKYEQQRFSMLRKYPRVPCHITMDMAAEGRAFNCFALDISAGGVFVESCEPFTMDQTVSMCFSLANDQLPLKIKGRVVRVEHDGLGIRYEDLTGYQREIMKDLINRLHLEISSRFRDPYTR